MEGRESNEGFHKEGDVVAIRLLKATLMRITMKFVDVKWCKERHKWGTIFRL